MKSIIFMSVLVFLCVGCSTGLKKDCEKLHGTYIDNDAHEACVIMKGKG